MGGSEHPNIPIGMGKMDMKEYTGRHFNRPRGGVNQTDERFPAMNSLDIETSDGTRIPLSEYDLK